MSRSWQFWNNAVKITVGSLSKRMPILKAFCSTFRRMFCMNSITKSANYRRKLASTLLTHYWVSVPGRSTNSSNTILMMRLWMSLGRQCKSSKKTTLSSAKNLWTKIRLSKYSWINLPSPRWKSSTFSWTSVAWLCRTKFKQCCKSKH